MLWLFDSKKIEDTITQLYNTRTWQTAGRTDGQTDRHRTMAQAALMHSIARQKRVSMHAYW